MIKQLRYNKHIQSLADQCAKDNGYFCAIYRCRVDDFFYFSPSYDDSYVRDEGLPVLIFVRGNEADTISGFLALDILGTLHFRDCRRGRQIFRQIMSNLENNVYKSDKEKQYYREIVYACTDHEYNVPIDKRTMYEFLEIAERFNKKLEIVPTTESKERCDGWEYYIRLI